ncbi:hypothetical protein MVLG_01027 [Microbotryum lychnidis-dioicae p1A1 Lamole]|uniref:HBS1-like protein N-terminal domain-containing protein n=1 Tax=Microbotryum lychnidis-dioicae (strain p1A1 Lamole / MvSl-1064) TaxID=683840 RepID=U5H0V8_USTV1|nr:hypothetical protein MVLG_01027 [Microbotryum lychnidis-dioicae p1A1 Lamole]|eukprot:KDE08935.1 hypothetical protein MVLG_01027 [Microbotryum lychnidis-dioicae p1A1 Lamole]
MQSRHRAVKQLDLAEQLDDDAIDSEGDDAYDMDDEQYAHMESGLSAVQNLLGPNTPISDKEIRDSLWDSYFDIDGTVAYLLDAQHKREAAKARAEGELTSAMAVETAEPPTSSLANLDISSSFIPPTPSATATATKPPMSKLAAKMAARKQAAADSKGSTPTETSLAPVAAVEGPKLSKLQQKMRASKQARAAAIAGAAGTSVTSADSPAVPPPVDTQSRVELTVAPASDFVVPPALLASASAFAHVLVPPPPMSTADRLTRIEQTFARCGGAENVAEFGLSPDDKVLEARKGTAVAAGAPIRRRV